MHAGVDVTSLELNDIRVGLTEFCLLMSIYSFKYKGPGGLGSSDKLEIKNSSSIFIQCSKII